MNDRPSGVLMVELKESRRFYFGSVDGCGRARSGGRDRGVAGRPRRLYRPEDKLLAFLEAL